MFSAPRFGYLAVLAVPALLVVPSLSHVRCALAQAGTSSAAEGQGYMEIIWKDNLLSLSVAGVDVHKLIGAISEKTDEFIAFMEKTFPIAHSQDERFLDRNLIKFRVLDGKDPMDVVYAIVDAIWDIPSLSFDGRNMLTKVLFATVNGMGSKSIEVYDQRDYALKEGETSKLRGKSREEIYQAGILPFIQKGNPMRDIIPLEGRTEYFYKGYINVSLEGADAITVGFDGIMDLCNRQDGIIVAHFASKISEDKATRHDTYVLYFPGLDGEEEHYRKRQEVRKELAGMLKREDFPAGFVQVPFWHIGTFDAASGGPHDE